MSLFVRYRHGSPLEIPPHFKETIQSSWETFVDRASLLSRIQQINDGSGWGIAVESTWKQVLVELWDGFERFFRQDHVHWQPKVREYLRLLGQANLNALSETW